MIKTGGEGAPGLWLQPACSTNPSVLGGPEGLQPWANQDLLPAEAAAKGSGETAWSGEGPAEGAAAAGAAEWTMIEGVVGGLNVESLEVTLLDGGLLLL